MKFLESNNELVFFDQTLNRATSFLPHCHQFR